MSILKRDVEGMKVNSEKLGIGTLYPILVCMVTGRTWNSVTGGIDKIRYTEAEVFKTKFILYIFIYFSISISFSLFPERRIC